MSGLRDLTRSRMAEAALINELLTRHRVDRLETALESYKKMTEPLRRDFWGRLRWLLTGR